MALVQVSSRQNTTARTRQGEEFGAPPPGDACRGVVELHEQLFELVGVVALVTAVAVALGHGVTALMQGWGGGAGDQVAGDRGPVAVAGMGGAGRAVPGRAAVRS